MAETRLFHDIQISSHEIEIRKLTLSDVWSSLGAGYNDFMSKPSSSAVLLLIYYPLFALLFTQFLIRDDLHYMIFPMVGGFTLLGPIVCTAVLEMSRRIELGLDIRWRSAFNFIHTSAFAPILGLSIFMMLLYVSWLNMAELIYFGLYTTDLPSTLDEFVSQLLTTQRGGALIMYGVGVGFLFAVAALAISVVAFPLLLDKPTTMLTAIKTSIRAVGSNVLVMAVWGLVVLAALAAGAALFLVGLAAVLPILGHSTWHLYRKVIAP